MRRQILLCGFEPFGGADTNPSWEAVRALDGWQFTGTTGAFEVVARQLPCIFGESVRTLNGWMAELRPHCVIAVGQAMGRSAISPERVAINLDDARICDNAGQQPVDLPVVPGGPSAYFSTLPIKAMVARVRAAGIAAEISHSAGTFVCNHLFYGLMHHVAQSPGSAVRAGFIHVPCLPEQAVGQNPPVPSMPLSDVIAALRIAVQVSVADGDDLKVPGGTLH